MVIDGTYAGMAGKVVAVPLPGARHRVVCVALEIFGVIIPVELQPEQVGLRD
jgi:transcription antitermination factor NusG